MLLFGAALGMAFMLILDRMYCIFGRAPMKLSNSEKTLLRQALNEAADEMYDQNRLIALQFEVLAHKLTGTPRRFTS